MSETINFEDYYSNVEMWTEHCENFTRVPIGIVDSMNFDIEYDEEGINGPASAHTIMIGSSGSGKTTFLHAFVIGLALKYSPKEVRFFLVDLRHGGFQDFALYKLPHAEIVASDLDWGMHTLELTIQKMTERRKLFDERNVENYRKFRNNYPDEVLPRYFVIIENYEGMFRNSKSRCRAKDYIDIITEKARTYGIHLFLSSQSCPLDRETLYKFTTKIVLKSEGRAETARMLLGPGNRYKDTVPHLLYESLIVMASHTYKTKYYYLPREQRNKYLEQINTKVADEGMDLPRQLVFDGFAKAYLSNNHAYTQLRPMPRIKSVQFSPGEKVFVDGNDLMINIQRAKGGNLYVTGGELQTSVRVLYGCLASMLPQFEKNGENAVRFDMFNCVDPSEEFKETLDRSLLSIAQDYPSSRVYDDSYMEKVLDEALFDLAERKNSTEKFYPSRFIVIFQMDNSESLNPIEECVGSGFRAERSSTIQKIVDLVVEGPQYGIHCLLHTHDYSALERLCGLAIDKNDQIKTGEPCAFNPQKTLLYTMLSNVRHRVLLQMSAEESKALMRARNANSLDHWTYMGNRAIYYDATNPTITNTIIKPYEFEITPQEEQPNG